MLWKEMYFARNNARSRIVGVILFATATGFLGYGLYELGWDALAEVLSYGYGADTPSTSRTNFNIFLRFAETTLFI